MLRRLFQFLTGQNHQVLLDAEESVSEVVDPSFVKLNELSTIKNINNQSQVLQVNSEGIFNENTIPPSVVCREAVLDQSQKVAGYSFTLSRSVNERVRKSSELIQRLYDDILLGNVLRMDLKRLLGHRLAFIPISPSSLDRQPLEQLPREGIVLVITSLAELTQQSSAYIARLTILKSSGFRIGLQGDVTLPSLQPFLDLAEFVFIDIGSSDLGTIKSRIDAISLQVMGKFLVATNIRLLDEFHVSAKLPFQYFQGTFVSSREEWAVPAMDAGRIKILSLLNLIRQDAENATIVQTFKQDPALSFKVLRYINSAGFGLATKVSSIEQALLILGRDNLYRWLTLLLFTSGTGNALDSALMENALVRARLAELCAKDALPANERDELFVAGIFSLLDILLRMPMEKVVEQVSLPSSVVEALLHKSGKYAPYLELAEACEAFDHERIVILSNQIGVDLSEVSINQTEAIVWAELAN